MNTYNTSTACDKHCVLAKLKPNAIQMKLTQYLSDRPQDTAHYARQDGLRVHARLVPLDDAVDDEDDGAGEEYAREVREHVVHTVGAVLPVTAHTCRVNTVMITVLSSHPIRQRYKKRPHSRWQLKRILQHNNSRDIATE